MRTNTTAAHDNHKGIAEFGETVVGQKDSVSCELFEDQSWVMVSMRNIVVPLLQHTFIVVAESRSSRQCCTPLVVSVANKFSRRRATKIVYLLSGQSAPRNFTEYVEHTLFTS